MTKEQIAAYEYGAAKNGAIISALPQANAILLEWKGDILLDEWITILTRGLLEIKERKISAWIADTSLLGTIADEHNSWVQETWIPQAIQNGVKKLVVMLPKSAIGEIAMQELMDNLEETTANTQADLQTFYTNNLEDAIAWINK
jgi:hypothetical protein